MAVLESVQILHLFQRLNDELIRRNIKGELYLVGGAVMCLVHQVRVTTKDVDGLFFPSTEVRAAAERVAEEEGVEPNWLNDAVKGYFSATGAFEGFLELSHLKIFVAHPEYLLAMKCLAMRLDAQFHDVEDVQFLLQHLKIADYETALGVIQKFYPLERFPKNLVHA